MCHSLLSVQGGVRAEAENQGSERAGGFGQNRAGEALTSCGKIVAGSPIGGIPAVLVGKPGQEEAQREGCQVQRQDDHVQKVPPVQEVTVQALNPHLLAFKPQET